MREPAMAKRDDHPNPVTSYDEYVRRYLPDEAEDVLHRPDADPTAVGEEVGRQVVERAMAKLASTED